MAYASKVVLHVRIYYIALSLKTNFLKQFLQRLMLRFSRSKPVRTLIENPFIHWRQDFAHCCLQNFILDRWYSQRALLPFSFGYVHPPDMWCSIASVFKSLQ